MIIRIRDLRLPLDYKDPDLKKAAAQKLNIHTADIQECRLIKRAIDARRKTVYFSCTVDIRIQKEGLISADRFSSPEISLVEEKRPEPLLPGNRELDYSPIIVGSGPAGIFCALSLARQGYKPIVIEQGQDMDQRIRSVDRFWKSGKLDPYSNTQFGEGGAGTFSDGKLTTRIGDERISSVIETFIQYGADEEIRYVKKPHVGTDAIRKVIKNMREAIIDLGGEFYFQTRLTDININHSLIKSIQINKAEEIPCSLLVLAVGNSAREVYRMLQNKGIPMISKAFALGVRVEHRQELIDRLQYGDYAGHPRLGAADYHLTYQDRQTGRALYTFCMCPGGSVIAASSAAEQVVTNGMSYFSRDTGIANSALVVTVNPADWNQQVLGGIALQESLEKRAFKAGGSNYHAPAQLLKDFLVRKGSEDLSQSLATYQPGVEPTDLFKVLPEEIGEVLWRGLQYWGQKMPGFIDQNAVLTGLETRTSAPVRILRNENMCSCGIENLYPSGEGAGYAGGIMSSAVDGLKAAEQIIRTYRKPNHKAEIKNSSVVNARRVADNEEEM